MTTPQFRLSKIRLNEVSLVHSGDDPSARVVFSKANCTRKHKKGKACTTCGMIMKGGPEGKDMMMSRGLDAKSFKHAKRAKKRRGKKMVDAGRKDRSMMYKSGEE